MPELASLPDGFAVTERFTAHGFNDERGIWVDVEVVDGHAYARRVCVETDRETGVGSAMLRTIPIRRTIRDEIVFGGHLRRVKLTAEGAEVVPVETMDEDAILAIKRLIGYVEVEEGQ